MRKYKINESQKYYDYLAKNIYLEAFKMLQLLSYPWDKPKDRISEIIVTYKLAHGKSVNEFMLLHHLKMYSPEDRVKMQNILKNMNLNLPDNLSILYYAAQKTLFDFLNELYNNEHTVSKFHDFFNSQRKFNISTNIPNKFSESIRKKLVEYFNIDDLLTYISKDENLKIELEKDDLDVSPSNISDILEKNSVKQYLEDLMLAIVEGGLENE